ncbi:ABC-type uncharacterized transport system, substrate-binding protein [Halopseudomonas xinjiangensis]|uniref:ABC-type uncharacterized transport system, substrate-binding protein n=1 Tax=Halopseudomonas xinjiangensis TaxID=487184 RepID=A0A1H1PMT7_9GAMM|nr:hypothetical protein [Halopseudomonas xinjiangensis]SDS12463.1 ABC-type uncharacterized transport system, substrate-binding protein [Halopseudomonas xinjiangensis]
MPAHRLISALLVWLAASLAHAAEIAVVIPGETALTQEFVEALRERRPEDRVTVASVQQYEQSTPDADVLVTMGQRSMAWRLASQTDTPTIATYVTASSVQAIEAQLPASVQALLATPKPQRQLALARLLLPRLDTVGLLHSPATASRVDAWRKAAQEQQLEVSAALVGEASELARRVADVLDSSDALVGLDDPSIYNADNLKTILLTSYARNKVLIGPSAPFISAGSLSTTYSTAREMADSVDQMLNATWAPAAVRYPEQFSVLSNQQVARSLGLPIPDDDRLAEILSQQEQLP